MASDPTPQPSTADPPVVQDLPVTPDPNYYIESGAA